MRRGPSRVKSCSTCRSAKTRCSLGQPCSRCATRQIECRYTSDATSARPLSTYRHLEPARIALPETPAHTPAWGSGSSLLVSTPHIDHSSTFISTFDQSESQLSSSQDGESTSIETPNRVTGQVLCMRTRIDAQDSLTASILFGQLMRYPQMLADGAKLPPFISPSCVLSAEGQCPSDAPHACLPETLAVCASLAKMFFSRTPGSANFIWKQIQAEVTRLASSHNNMGLDDKLQGIQALIIYTMLQALDHDTKSLDDPSAIVSTCETFSRDLFVQVPVTYEAEALCNSRKEWVEIESLRRIGVLLYIIDLTLVTGGTNTSNGECPAALCVPLPCANELWDTIGNSSWSKFYQRHKQRSRPRQLTLGSLLLVRNGSDLFNTEEGSADDVAESLNVWCRRADDLGLLLWMATSLERNEQTLTRNVRGPM